MRRLLLASLLVALPAAAQQPRPVQNAERGRARAQAQQREAADHAAAAAAEEQRLARERVAAAARLGDIEADVAERAAEVGALAGERDAAAARLTERARALAPLVPLMQRLALYPAETLLAVPSPPEQTVRGLSVLRGLARGLEREAAALREEQARLAARQQAVDEALPRLRTAQAAQAELARSLDQQIAAARADRREAEEAGAEAGRRAAAEAARADSLRTALAALEAGRSRAEAQARDDALRAERQRADAAAAEARRRQETLARPPASAPEPRGQMTPPVAGMVVRSWGEPSDAGPASGVSYRSAPQARVVAPCGGRVRFAGPFRSFGVLVILDCGGGTALVLAGLGRLDVAVGASVLAGEPVGTMPAWDPAAAGAHPALYVELRRDGQAVNPAPFLRTRG